MEIENHKNKQKARALCVCEMKQDKASKNRQERV